MTIRLDLLIYAMTVLFLISLLGVMYELNGLQKFRVEVEQQRLSRETEILNLAKATVDISREVNRLRGIGINCTICH